MNRSTTVTTVGSRRRTAGRRALGGVALLLLLACSPVPGESGGPVPPDTGTADATPAGPGPADLAGPSPVPPALRPTIPGPPTTPPAQICGNSSVLDGPATPPAGAVTVDVGDDLGTLTADHPAGTTFWLAPGTHRFTNSIVPKDDNTYLGAPGAIVDGGDTLNIAFWEEYFDRSTDNVRLSHLTIQNFTSAGEDQGAVYAGTGWRIDHTTFRDNGYVALFVGTDNVVEYSCFENNGQLGIGTYRLDEPAHNVTVDHNEFRYNNARNLQGCGCAGGMKWWETQAGKFTNNWVHHNRGAGVWADYNNAEMLFDGNYINDNDSEGIFYEISYNFMISNNTLVRNALVKGASKNGNFPIAAIYISESGGVDEPGLRYSRSEIHHNYLEDNWDGVALWESGNRYVGTDGDGFAPAYADPSRWKTQNIVVHNNEFRMNKTAAGCEGNPNCGRNGLFSDWVPVPGGPSTSPNLSNNQYQLAVSFNQNNRFQDNVYFGEWQFVAYDPSLLYDWTTWRNPRPTPAASFNYPAPGSYGFAQDTGSSRK